MIGMVQDERTNVGGSSGVVVKRAIVMGAVAALDEFAGRGGPRPIALEARAWLTSIACGRSRDCGYPHELRTTALLWQRCPHPYTGLSKPSGEPRASRD